MEILDSGSYFQPISSGQNITGDFALQKETVNTDQDYHRTIVAAKMVRNKSSSGGLTVEEVKFKSLVRTTLFNKMKFIGTDADLDIGAPAYDCIVKMVTVVEEKGETLAQYWNNYRKHVRVALNSKRGTVNQMIRTAFMSKWKLVCNHGYQGIRDSPLGF